MIKLIVATKAKRARDAGRVILQFGTGLNSMMFHLTRAEEDQFRKVLGTPARRVEKKCVRSSKRRRYTASERGPGALKQEPNYEEELYG